MKKRILLIIAIIILLAFTGLFFYNFKNFSTAGIIVKDFLLRVRQVNDLKRDILMSGQVPVSQNGLEHYSQGGVVFNGIGYFTGNWKDREKGEFYRKSRNFPYVVSFDVQTFQKIRTYAFEDTYDSTPLLLETQDGRNLSWLMNILVHGPKLSMPILVILPGLALPFTHK